MEDVLGSDKLVKLVVSEKTAPGGVRAEKGDFQNGTVLSEGVMQGPSADTVCCGDRGCFTFGATPLVLAVDCQIHG